MLIARPVTPSVDLLSPNKKSSRCRDTTPNYWDWEKHDSEVWHSA